jgi:hypothetical protein
VDRIHVDGSQDGNQRMNNVSSVQAPAKTGLEDDEIDAPAPKIVEGKCRCNFEKCWVTLLVNTCTNALDTPDNVCIIDRPTVDLDSFVESNQMRRGEESRFDSGRTTNRVNHRADRSFAVGARDMDEPQAILWISQGSQQLPNVIEPELDSKLLGPEQPIDSGAVSCVHLEFK